MKIVLTLFCCIILLGIPSCEKSIPQSEYVTIAASIYPVYDITRQLLQDNTELFWIVPSGANPHTYEPVPSTVKKLQTVKLFIGIHPEFDGWIENYLSEDTKILYLYDTVHEKREIVQHEEDNEIHSRERDEVEFNPHIWLSVRNAGKIACQIALTITDARPDLKERIDANLKTYTKALDQLDKELKDLFSTVRSRRFIQWHPAWNYFADDYHLQITGSLEQGHGSNPSVQHMHHLIQSARKENVHIVVVGLNISSKSADTLIREIDGVRIQMDTMGNPEDEKKSTYLKLMRFNAYQLYHALNQ